MTGTDSQDLTNILGSTVAISSPIHSQEKQLSRPGAVSPPSTFVWEATIPGERFQTSCPC